MSPVSSAIEQVMTENQALPGVQSTDFSWAVPWKKEVSLSQKHCPTKVGTLNAGVYFGSNNSLISLLTSCARASQVASFTAN